MDMDDLKDTIVHQSVTIAKQERMIADLQKQLSTLERDNSDLEYAVGERDMKIESLVKKIGLLTAEEIREADSGHRADTNMESDSESVVEVAEGKRGAEQQSGEQEAKKQRTE